MGAYLDTAVAPDTGIIIKVNPLFIMADRTGRAVFPALPAQFTEFVSTDRPLYKMLPYKAVKSRGAEHKGRYPGETEVPDHRKIAINFDFTGNKSQLSRNPVCEQIIRIHAEYPAHGTVY